MAGISNIVLSLVFAGMAVGNGGSAPIKMDIHRALLNIGAPNLPPADSPPPEHINAERWVVDDVFTLASEKKKFSDAMVTPAYLTGKGCSDVKSSGYYMEEPEGSIIFWYECS
ncbi:MAG: hypothetical protein DHS20C02_10510 [Micavibrio sp.]|nr:MAG: hypothetical protein DHS20C02_10510 [Micavibrio sp.]